MATKDTIKALQLVLLNDNTSQDIDPKDNRDSFNLILDNFLALIQDELLIEKLTNLYIADNAITTSKIADLSVVENKLATSSVSSAKIKAANVVTASVKDLNITLGKLSQPVQDLLLAVGGGAITNNPDDEDIESVASKLKFKDRTTSGNQRGRRIIRADFDFTNIPAGYDNSIWEIRYEHDVLGANFTIPSGVVLEENGGLITNYGIITGDGTKIDCRLSQLFDTSGSFQGTWKIKNTMPEWFGAIGDNVVNDTLACQAALNFAINTDTHRVFFTSKYKVENLIMSDRVEIVGNGRDTSSIEAISSVDNNYLVATSLYFTGVSSNYATNIKDITIDAKGVKEYAVAWRTWGSFIEKCYIQGATKTDLLIPTDAKDGTLIGFTMVNNIVRNNWLGHDQGTAERNLYVRDPSNKATDMMMLNNFVSSASIECVRLESMAGYNVSGNHMYGAPISATFNKGGLGTNIRGNYFETDVVIDDILPSDESLTFGPANFLIGQLIVSFGNTGRKVISIANTYQGGILHNFFAADKILISKNDIFNTNDPFTFSSGASTGRVDIVNGYLTNLDKHITSSFTGNKFRWDRSGSVEYGNALEFVQKGFEGGGGIKTASLTIDLLGGGDISPSFDFTLAMRQFHTGPLLVAYYLKGTVIFKSSTGDIALVNNFENLTPAEFTVAPLASAVNNGDGTITITVTWTPATSDGFGGWTLKGN